MVKTCKLNGRPLSKSSVRAYNMPKGRDGKPLPWVVELARLRAQGHRDLMWLASRILVCKSRIYQVMTSPEYAQLEMMEGLLMLERRRPEALVALADRAARGEPNAVRLVCELTGVLSPARPLLVSITKLLGDVETPTPRRAVPVAQDHAALVRERDRLFRELLGENPVDVVFRDVGPATAVSQ